MRTEGRTTVRRKVAIDADLVAFFGEDEDSLSDLVNRLLRAELARDPSHPGPARVSPE